MLVGGVLTRLAFAAVLLFPMKVGAIILVKRKITADLAVIFLKMVDLKGFEPTTLRMRTVRSPN